MKTNIFLYVVTYGDSRSKNHCFNWREACHFMKQMIDEGYGYISVSRVTK